MEEQRRPPVKTAMTPKERYEARQAAKRAGYTVSEKRIGDIHDVDPEELLFDIANSLDRIAAGIDALANKGGAE